MKFYTRIFILIITLALASCSGYQRLLKSSDYELKYKKAVEYYEANDFVKALPLFEELVTIFRGTSKGEDVYYYYAYCNYEVGDNLLASYHFKNLQKTYPTGKYAEEAGFMAAYCFYLDSPRYSLDQSNSISAISEFQMFVELYPQSKYMPECNAYLDKLREKLELKAYENAKLYYKIGEYKASVFAFKNMLRDFPDNKYREEVNYLIVKASYLLATNSIDEKKTERFVATSEYYIKFADNFGNSKYLKSAEAMYESAQKHIDKANKTTNR